MLKINFKDYKFYSYLLIIFGFLSIYNEVDFENNIFFLAILFFSIIQNYLNYKYKNFYSGLIALIAIYIQFRFNDFTISKEYFLNLILIFLFLKFAELNSKENCYFFNYTAVFLGISSLIYGQDLISSLISLTIIFVSIIQLYLLNQTTIIALNIRYILKYLFYSLSIFPIIALIYFVFPRTEINIKLFETQKNQLGIPEKISLGSFQDISDSEEIVFIFDNYESKKKDDLYFRVKVFDVIDKNKDWINLNYQNLLTKFPKSIKIKKENFELNQHSKIILFPHDKQWLPKLKNFSYSNNKIMSNLFNDTQKYNSKISKKIAFKIFPQEKEIKYEKDILEFYTLIPNSVSSNLINWAKKNYLSSESDEEYLKKILKRFKTDDYFYSLNPDPISNNYEKFFFETKVGYCEYYAGVFTILARAANIPARIVSGYYGGSYNELGKFYTFRQQDAHSWVEVYLNNKWVRYDPTLSIPTENIINSNNLNLNNNQTSSGILAEDNNADAVLNVMLYFDYVNYVWTNKFINYGQKERSQFIKENISSDKNIIYLTMLLIILCMMILIYKLLKFIIKRKILFSTFFIALQKNHKKINLSMTHQEMFLNLNSNDQKKYKELFKVYETIKFSSSNPVTFKKFFDINLDILKYKFF